VTDVSDKNNNEFQDEIRIINSGNVNIGLLGLMPYGYVSKPQSFGRTYCLHLQP
jgi:hypothetical protein